MRAKTGGAAMPILLLEIRRVTGVLTAWCKLHWQLVAVASVAFITIIIEGRRKAVGGADKFETAIAAQGAEQEIKQVAVEQGAAAAHQAVAEKYHEQLAALDISGQAEAAKLMDDPVALTKFLTQDAPPK